jgi:hypothetical protein
MSDGGQVAVTDAEQPAREAQARGPALRAALGRVTGRTALEHQISALSERVDVLEAQLAQERRLQRRVAELTDVVMQLLIRPDLGEPEELQSRLDRFEDEL